MQLEIKIFQGYSSLAYASGERACVTSAPTAGVASPPCQIVIPAVIKAVFQPEPAPYVASAGNYAPALPPIIIEEDDGDNWQNLLYLLMLAKNNKRGGSVYNGGWNCGCGNNCGGFDCHSIPYPYPNNCCSVGYDHGYYPDDCAVTPVCPSKEINLIIKTDSGTCTYAK